jgi:hypothetical protein
MREYEFSSQRPAGCVADRQANTDSHGTVTIVLTTPP